MNKKDVLELKRRLKKDDCTFTKMCGCYVTGEKKIILNFRETFLNLEEDEFFKYLEIAKKVLSGTIGNNLLELNFPLEEEEEGGRQYSLMQLKQSELKNDELLENFYRSVIDSYDYEGNFLILLFHDAYDVITKTKDNLKLDESEEVYQYILCAICPVSLSKPGLRYFEDDNKIGARIRDWVVEMPTNGFVFPAFTDRSTDIDSVMYYTKNAKEPHEELMEDVLGCSSKKTATQQKEAFQNIVHKALDNNEEKAAKVFMDIQDNLNTMVEDHKTVNEKDADPIILTSDNISDVLCDSGVPEDITEKIEKSYNEQFNDAPPVIEHLLDSKVLKTNEQRKKEERLKNQVEILKTELEKTKEANLANENAINEEDLPETEDQENTTSSDIIVNVNPEKVDKIKSEIINGQKCLIIPVDENEQAKVNGKETFL